MKYVWILETFPKRINSIGSVGVIIQPDKDQLLEIHSFFVAPQMNNMQFRVRLYYGVLACKMFWDEAIATGEVLSFPNGDYLTSFKNYQPRTIFLTEDDSLRIEDNSVQVNDYFKVHIRGFSNTYAKPTVTLVDSTNNNLGSGIAEVTSARRK